MTIELTIKELAEMRQRQRLLDVELNLARGWIDIENVEVSQETSRIAKLVLFQPESTFDCR